MIITLLMVMLAMLIVPLEIITAALPLLPIFTPPLGTVLPLAHQAITQILPPSHVQCVSTLVAPATTPLTAQAAHLIATVI
jgi:hypothetical protein